MSERFNIKQNHETGWYQVIDSESRHIIEYNTLEEAQAFIHGYKMTMTERFAIRYDSKTDLYEISDSENTGIKHYIQKEKFESFVCEDEMYAPVDDNASDEKESDKLMNMYALLIDFYQNYDLSKWENIFLERSLEIVADNALSQKYWEDQEKEKENG